MFGAFVVHYHLLSITFFGMTNSGIYLTFKALPMISNISYSSTVVGGTALYFCALEPKSVGNSVNLVAILGLITIILTFVVFESKESK